MGKYQPAVEQNVAAITNNPYAPGVTSAAQAGGDVLSGIGGQAAGAGQALLGQAPGIASYIDPALRTGFDPQNALYSQYRQAEQDATNADLANRGLNYSAAGAGVAGQNLTNFDLQWLNSLAQRQATAANTASTLAGASGAAGQAGAGLGATGAQDIAGGAFMPYAASTGISEQNIQALAQATGIPQQQIANYLQYYGEGTSQANAAVNAAQARSQQQSGIFGGLGSGLSLLFGGGGMFGKNGAFAGLL